MFFQDHGGAFEKTRKRWDKEHTPLSVRQTCEHLRNTFPSIIEKPLTESNESDLETRFQAMKYFV